MSASGTQQCQVQLSSVAADGGVAINGSIVVEPDGGIAGVSLQEGSGNRSGCVGGWDPATQTLTLDCGGVGFGQSCVATLTRTGSCGSGSSSSGGTGGSAVTVAVDNTVTHQVIAGWGGSVPAGGISLAQLPQVLTLLYGTLNLTSMQAGGLVEEPDGGTMTQNSDLDAGVIDWAGFQGGQEQGTHDDWIELASSTDGGTGLLTAYELGLQGYVLGGAFPNVRWGNPWLDPIRTATPQLYLQYVAREALADYEYWQNNYGAVPPLFQFGYEDLTGNRDLFIGGSTDNYPGGATQEEVDLVKATGARLAANGFANVRFLISSEEAVSTSLSLATAILADPVAAAYVGAIGYHEYPYGSPYSDLAQVLAASGTGNPPASEIQVRNSIRDLGKTYGVPVWLDEVSNAAVNGLSGSSFDTLRGRAIDIHDNLIYADIATFWLYANVNSTVTQQQSFPTLAALEAAEGGDCAVAGDPTSNTWEITMGGYALGHYARWVKPGAVRVDATSSDALLQVAAFDDSAAGTEAFVLINNDSQTLTVTLDLAGATFVGSAAGEQSTAGLYFSALTPVAPTNGTTLTVALPAQSVTSISAPIGP